MRRLVQETTFTFAFPLTMACAATWTHVLLVGAHLALRA
jgi:hypothetical protein